MKKRTSVGLEKETLDKLKSIKLAKRESYDEIICRLIDNQIKKEGENENEKQNNGNSIYNK